MIRTVRVLGCPPRPNLKFQANQLVNVLWDLAHDANAWSCVYIVRIILQTQHHDRWMSWIRETDLLVLYPTKKKKKREKEQRPYMIFSSC